MRIKATLDKSSRPNSYHPIVIQAGKVRMALDRKHCGFKKGNSDGLKITLFLSACVLFFCFRSKHAKLSTKEIERDG